MKDLTIEEKAARYDKAIDVARKINSGEGVAAPSGWTTCEVIFPELRESEDERIRKELLEHCKNQAKPYIQTGNKCPQIQSWIDWLEKQCEQKPADKVEPKFKIGDIIKPKCYRETHSIKAIGERYYILDIDVKIPFRDEDDWELVEQNTAWSEKYIADVFEKVGLAKIVREQSNDVLTNALQDAMIELSKFTPQPKQAWSEEDEERLNDTIGCLTIYKEDTDVRRSQSALNDVFANIDWLRSLRPREMNKWRKEDEVNINAIIDYLKKTDKNKNRGYINFLKSLRPHSQWKPGDEQINILFKYAEQNNKDGSILTSLYQDLKRLKE